MRKVLTSLLAGATVLGAVTLLGPFSGPARAAQLVQATADTMLQDVYDMQRPVFLIVVRPDCPECLDLVHAIEQVAATNEDFKFVVTDANAFQVPAEKAPLVAVIVRAVRYAPLFTAANFATGDAAGLEAFLKERAAAARDLLAAHSEESRLAQRANELRGRGWERMQLPLENGEAARAERIRLDEEAAELTSQAADKQREVAAIIKRERQLSVR